MFQKFKFATGIAAAALCPVVGQAPAYAETPAETAQLFGAREGVGHVSLSPDGSRFSYIAPYGAQGEALYLVDLTQAAPTPQRVIAI